MEGCAIEAGDVRSLVGRDDTRCRKGKTILQQHTGHRLAGIEGRGRVGRELGQTIGEAVPQVDDGTVRTLVHGHFGVEHVQAGPLLSEPGVANAGAGIGVRIGHAQLGDIGFGHAGPQELSAGKGQWVGGGLLCGEREGRRDGKAKKQGSGHGSGKGAGKLPHWRTERQCRMPFGWGS